MKWPKSISPFDVVIIPSIIKIIKKIRKSSKNLQRIKKTKY